MKYYIRLSGDSDASISTTNNVLGESSFSTFYTENGYRALRNIVMNYPEVLEDVKIFDDTNKQYTIEEFFDSIKKLNIIVQ